MSHFLDTHFAECADTDSEWEGWWVTMSDPSSHGPSYELCTVAGGREMRKYALEICKRWNAFEAGGEVAALRAALATMIEHASEKYPHFESERGQRDIQMAKLAMGLVDEVEDFAIRTPADMVVERDGDAVRVCSVPFVMQKSEHYRKD